MDVLDVLDVLRDLGPNPMGLTFSESIASCPASLSDAGQPFSARYPGLVRKRQDTGHFMGLHCMLRLWDFSLQVCVGR